MYNVKMKTRLFSVLYVIAVFYISCGLCEPLAQLQKLVASPPPLIEIPTTSASSVPPPLPTASTNVATNTSSNDSNRTTNNTKSTSVNSVSVTQIPLLGENGTGIRHEKDGKTIPSLVSDPIRDDDGNFTDQDVLNETPEKVKAQMNLQNLTYDNHSFYNSTFIGNVTYFDSYWANITTKLKPEIHTILSHSHRRATNQKITFEFPFYGHQLHNVTVATGGFIYTGEHVHHWLAATQYIAPLMANFDTTLTNDSLVKYVDDGEKFTVIWEKVPLQEDVTKPFTFAVTLYKNGDVVFAYKDIPINITNINDSDHPVKVGISDAYLTDKVIMFVRRKTIYEYHRVSFKKHDITNKTILWLTALPTCLAYNTCDTCANHETGFNCAWCESIRKCSSGTDRNKQDWIVRNCEKTAVTNETQCPTRVTPDTAAPGIEDKAGTIYSMDVGANTNTVVVTTSEVPVVSKNISKAASLPVSAQPSPQSPVGGVAVAFLILSIICCLGGWIAYAFKNPHTRSGQLLIKYRPSQWSWRRGEARYTAATIHM